MHDHSHDHESQDHDAAHEFGELTPYEESLFRRQQVMHVATEIYKAGIPKGCVSPQYAEDPYFSPAQAVDRAVELIAAVDDYVVSRRINPD